DARISDFLLDRNDMLLKGRLHPIHGVARLPICQAGFSIREGLPDERGTMRFAILGLAAIALTACQSTSSDTAPPAAQPAPAPAAPPPSGSAMLDSSVIITPPDKNVPKQYAAFSGVWVGTWDGPLDARLAVRSISAKGRVTVTYAWGSLGDMKPGIVDGQG